jgi:hypothetical protein
MDNKPKIKTADWKRDRDRIVVRPIPKPRGDFLPPGPNERLVEKAIDLSGSTRRRRGGGRRGDSGCIIV